MHHSAHPDHARHDLSLIAGHAAGDLSNPDSAAAAAALLSSCTACAEAHRDLVAISSATRALPRTARAPRDFRLTVEQAERLQRGSWLRSILRPFASARSATRPLAAAFTSVGVAGLLVATIVPGLLGGVASAPQRDSVQVGAGATYAPAIAPEAAGPTGGALGAAGGPTTEAGVKGAGDSGMYVAIGGESTGGDAAGKGGDTDADEDIRLAAEAAQVNLLLAGSLGLLAVGIALFGLRLAARRLR